MKAILVIPDQKESPCESVPCLALFPLLDRPFLQHIVEALAGRGIRDIHIICGRGADAIERFLGDGSRWGCSFLYYLIRDPERPEAVLRAVATEDGPYVLARADHLPILPNRFLESDQAMLFGQPSNWSGWGVLHSRELKRTASVPIAKLVDQIGARDPVWVSDKRSLTLRSLADIPAAQQRFLQSEVPGALVDAREVRPGAWLAPNAQIESSSTLCPPVLIGENSVVGAGARVGPFAVVGPNCMLDRDSNVQETTVCAGTYIGPGVELDGVIVEGRSVINPRRQTRASVDHRLLDHFAPVLPFTFGPGRLLAAVLYVLTLPVIAAIAFWLWLTREGPVFWQRRFVRIPLSVDESAWRVSAAYTLTPPHPHAAEYGWVIPATLRGVMLELLPALWCVARGHLRLVGLPPRDEDQLRAHAAQSPSLLQAAPGLVTELSLNSSERLTPEDCLLVDGFQIQTTGPGANRKRLCRFLLRALMFRSQRARESLFAEQPSSRTYPNTVESCCEG